MTDWAQTFSAQLANGQPYSSVAATEPQIDMSAAYEIQKSYVATIQDPVAGFKAALTAPAAQQMMNATEAVVGVLHAPGEFFGASIQPVRTSVLETEIGFVTAQDIRHPVTQENVFEHMQACVAMIEIASPNLATKPNGIDLVATNSASYGFLRGDQQAISADIDTTPITLHRNDELLHEGQGSDVMQSQAAALSWLVNKVLDLGYQILAGHLFMTGSIGAMHPAKPGRYRATYGALGELAFEIPA